jgi:Uncharacterized conserved protein (COG2071)
MLSYADRVYVRPVSLPNDDRTTIMKIPTLKGIIKRRLLVNFRADPAIIRRIIPPPFRPKLHRDYSIVGVCLIRLEHIRPAGLPGLLGISSENAAHRIAVEWTDSRGQEREGVYVPRRDTGSLINHLAGGRVFPGEHHSARFDVLDNGTQIDFAMKSEDKMVSVRLVGTQTDTLPSSSCFSSLSEASAFFAGGSIGYSRTQDLTRLDGLQLKTLEWRVNAVEVETVYSNFYADHSHFPEGSVVYDHTLIMRDIEHEWHKVEDLYTVKV